MSNLSFLYLGSDNDIIVLLKSTNNNIQNALNQYYDHGFKSTMKKSKISQNSLPCCSHGNGPDCKQCEKGIPSTSSSSTTATSLDLLLSMRSSDVNQEPSRDEKLMYFLGQRLIIGICTSKQASCIAGEDLEIRLDAGPTNQNHQNIKNNKIKNIKANNKKLSSQQNDRLESLNNKKTNPFFTSTKPSKHYNIKGGTSLSLSFYSTSTPSTSTSTSTFQGRFPKQLGDVLAPLIRKKFIKIFLTTCIDMNNIKLFSEIPMMIKILIAPYSFILPEVHYISNYHNKHNLYKNYFQRQLKDIYNKIKNKPFHMKIDVELEEQFKFYLF